MTNPIESDRQLLNKIKQSADHNFEPEEETENEIDPRCAICGNRRSWHPRDWR